MDTSGSNSFLCQLSDSLKKAGLPVNSLIKLIILVIIVIGIISTLFETNEAGYVSVQQSMSSGKLSVIPQPGLFCQCLGKVTKYREAGTYTFAQSEARPEAGKVAGKPRKEKGSINEVKKEIAVRFNDGGMGWISGVARFDLPKDKSDLALIHKNFRSFEKLLETGVIPTVKESVILTASLMSPGESYTTKRAMLTEMAKDQLVNGTYVTEDFVVEEKGPITGHIVTRNIVRVKMDGNKKVRNENPLARFGIEFKQFQITDIRYETETENIIKAKREALQQTIAAKISAERAIQERIAAEEMGKKDVKIAEYKAMVKKKTSVVEAEENKAVAVIRAQKDEEVAKIEKERALRSAKKKIELEKLDKEKSIIEAQKEFQVSKLNLQSAEQRKQVEILQGQGIAEKKKLIYDADGALQEKLDAYVKVMTVLAKELGKQKWVPDVTMNGKGGAADGNMAMNFMNMWMMKAAKDIGVEMKAGDKKTRRVR